ncbi:scavenger receptor class B member 1 [Eurytemora carolleeae]|uniref:scavenger receptor class B member 1 n=1 Tax=Eurytemora carolleeae TaxID=1294199 RepID=UPI000C793484|nr:scavenger receptor class B member 1 [Eurytemora carolleeae]|eukprot:XP_023331176.1 scavenger receptor class B member 1-like [Eurytemora affinis]
MGELQTEENGKAEKNGKVMKNGTENYENNGRVGGKGKGKNGNHLYRITPQIEEMEIEIENTVVKPGRSCCEKIALSSCLFGFVFIVGGVISALLMRPYVHNQIEENLVLAENGKAFHGWKDPPVTPILKIYFFNLTNSVEFLNGAKPIVNKVGPYVYLQEIHKTNVSFHDEGEKVTFSDNKTYYFSPDLSTGSETDQLILPNLPLLGAIKKFGNDLTTLSLFLSMLRSKTFGIDKGPFLNLNVREYLWGYPSLILSIAENQACESSRVEEFQGRGFEDDWDNWDDEEEDEKEEDVRSKAGVEENCRIDPLNLNKFGLFLNTNGTVRNQRTVHTGKNDLRLKGMYSSIGGESRISSWSNESCNLLDGRDPGTLTVDLKKDEPLGLYFQSLCRRINFRYMKTIQHYGIDAYRFSPVEETFNSGSESGSNSCYCSRPPCPPSGVFDLSQGCKENSPVLMSWPHFLYGDLELREGVDGIPPPDRENDSFQMELEPKWGTTLAIRARFQMNVFISNSGYSEFSKIKKGVYLPFLILDEGIPGPNQYVLSKVKMLMGLEDTVQSFTAVGGILLGLLCMIPEIIIWSRSCCCKTKSYSAVNKI